MRVFVYEHFTANGIGRAPDSPDHAIWREGRAMRDALVADFASVPGGTVVPDEVARSGLDALGWAARDADWTVVIAPEFDDTLADAASLAASAGRYLGPAGTGFRLGCDKLYLAEHWREHHIPTPATTEREPTACEAFPVVWKPRYGAGSTNTFLLTSTMDVARAKARRTAEEIANATPYDEMILQEFVPGRAASVAVLCGPSGSFPLVPAFQTLSDNGRFQYLGGELPIPPALAERAVRLAQRAVDCVPGLLGYVGVDLVLGDAGDGSRDFAIEINPRLTTSYVGLRALADFNIAEAMLQIAAGEPVEPFRWKTGRVRFGPDGTVTHLPTAW